MIGNTLGPEEAYRFARGEEVKSSTGLPAKLQRPLDFLVVVRSRREPRPGAANRRFGPGVAEVRLGSQGV